MPFARDPVHRARCPGAGTSAAGASGRRDPFGVELVGDGARREAVEGVESVDLPDDLGFLWSDASSVSHDGAGLVPHRFTAEARPVAAARRRWYPGRLPMAPEISSSVYTC